MLMSARRNTTPVQRGRQAGRASQPAPRLERLMHSTFPARFGEGRYAPNIGHSVAAQYWSRWPIATFCTATRCFVIQLRSRRVRLREADGVK
jgi:hypothetical protein